MDMGNLLYGSPDQAQSEGQATAPQAQPMVQSPEPGFMDKLRTDPKMLQSMLMMGTRLMAGPKPGQDPVGALGEAVMVGSATHNMLTENERANSLAQQEQDRRNQLADAQIGQVRTNTQRTQQEITQKGETFPEMKKKLALEVKQLTAAGRRDEALAKIQEFKANEGRLQQEFDLGVQKDQANISQSNASAGAAGASAEASRANSRLSNIKADAAGELYQEGQFNTVLHGAGKTGAGAAKDQLAGLKVTLKAAYPDSTDQEVARMALDINSGKKGGNIEVLKAILDYGTEDQKKGAQAKLAELAGAAPPPPDKGVVTPENLQATAKANPTMTLAQVKAALKAKGYRVD